jgi:hypothetical protein
MNVRKPLRPPFNLSWNIALPTPTESIVQVLSWVNLRNFWFFVRYLTLYWQES